MEKTTQILFYVLMVIYIVLLLMNPHFAPVEEPTFFLIRSKLVNTTLFT